jgi:predicted  nucleic acid-binding Zn-ribbon protein
MPDQKILTKEYVDNLAKALKEPDWVIDWEQECDNLIHTLRESWKELAGKVKENDVLRSSLEESLMKNERITKLNKYLIIKRDEFGWLKKQFKPLKDALAEKEKEIEGLKENFKLMIRNHQLQLTNLRSEVERLKSDDMIIQHRAFNDELVSQLDVARKAIRENWVADSHHGSVCIHCKRLVTLDRQRAEYIHPTPSDCIVLSSQDKGEVQ